MRTQQAVDKHAYLSDVMCSFHQRRAQEVPVDQDQVGVLRLQWDPHCGAGEGRGRDMIERQSQNRSGFSVRLLVSSVWNANGGGAAAGPPAVQNEESG